MGKWLGLHPVHWSLMFFPIIFFPLADVKVAIGLELMMQQSIRMPKNAVSWKNNLQFSMCTLCGVGGEETGGSKPPASRTLQSRLPTLFFLASSLLPFFRLWNIMQCCIISPYFFCFPPFWNSHLPPFPLPPPVPSCPLLSQAPAPCPPPPHNRNPSKKELQIQWIWIVQLDMQNFAFEQWAGCR